ncbi:hypothetical protein K1T71_003762 [Dendrolimus kikuchii]|uniref:Uncharacterized protein n=1 Tax=Dendrolimus kikuchii TaxID=765133 RepID=A0ACC1D9U9_9NEOP|nr:hypothetical protein K1T71_003762 [Dendrolimus kikuchii]
MVKIISTLLIIIYTSILSECRQFRFDYKYYREIDGYLKYNIVPASWHDARLRCLYEGAELASPINTNMLKALREIWTHGQGPCSTLWTGVHATFSKGDYFSVGGVPLARMPIKWSTNEPDNFQNVEDCLVLLTNGTVADVPCYDSFSYACFRKKTSVVTACGTIDPEYTLDSRTASCYKFHSAGLIWSRAFMTCAAEGGHLAVIDTVGEHLVLKDIFAKHPPNTLFNAKDRDIAFIGFSDWGKKGTWTTIHGSKIEDMIAASKGRWADGQPDNAFRDGEGESCGGIFRNGLYDDLWCNSPNVFICEKSPDSLLELD